MSALHSSMQASKEEKKKRLLELQEKKKLGAQSIKKVEAAKTPRNSNTSEASVAEIMQKVLSPVEPVLPPIIEETKAVYKPILSNSGTVGGISIKSRPKQSVKEDESQADLPKEPKKIKEEEQNPVTPKHSHTGHKEREKVVINEEEDMTERILRSNEINEFLEKSSRLVERALGQEDPDLYVPAENELKNIMTLYSSTYSYDRCVSSIK